MFALIFPIVARHWNESTRLNSIYIWKRYYYLKVVITQYRSQKLSFMAISRNSQLCSCGTTEQFFCFLITPDCCKRVRLLLRLIVKLKCGFLLTFIWKKKKTKGKGVLLYLRLMFKIEYFLKKEYSFNNNFLLDYNREILQ